MALDFERARFNMIEQQVRPWEVLDPRVLDALGRVRREDYVPARYRKMAFTDVALPLDGGEFMMKPVVEGRTLQALELGAENCVLEIGTGSGYLTACLAELGRDVVSIDINASLVERARTRLANAGYANVAVETADATSYEPGRRFDVVCVTGAVYEVPERFKSWLNPGGRLFVIRGESPAMEAVLITRVSERDYHVDSLFETDLPYLKNAAPPKRFAL